MTRVAGLVSRDGSPLTPPSWPPSWPCAWRRDTVILCGPQQSAGEDICVTTASVSTGHAQCDGAAAGDWILAAWTPKTHRLVLTRAANGQDCLFYWSDARRFAFANRKADLLTLLGARAKIDVVRAACAMEGALSPYGETFWCGVSTVPPGHRLTLDGSKIAVERWYVPQRRTLKGRDADLLAQFRHVYRQAVARSLGDGDVGISLSSGFDSASVAVQAAPILAERGARLFGYVARPLPGTPPVPGRRVDEWPVVQSLASTAGLRLEAVETPRGEVLTDMARWIDILGEPPLALGNIGWLLRIPRLAAAAGCGILLHATGGNMTVSWPGRPALAHPPWGMPFRTWRYWLVAGLAPRLIAWHRRRHRRIHPWTSFLTEGFRRQVGDMLSSRWDERQMPPLPLLPPDAPRTVKFRSGFAAGNRSSSGAVALAAAAGLLSRDPTNDPELAEFCLSLPNRLFWAGGRERGLIRDGFADLLPAVLLRATERGIQGRDLALRLIADADAVESLIETLRRAGYGEVIALDTVSAWWRRFQTAPADGDTPGWAHRIACALGLGQFLLRGDTPGGWQA